MISYLLLLGLFGSDEMQPGAGALTAPAERIVVIPRVQSKVLVVAGAPLGVSKFAQPYDPADHGEYAIGFGAVMDANERIIDIQYIGVSASGAGLGIGIDTTDDHIPRITDDGKHVQYWPLVDEGQWSAQDFNAAGVNVIVKARVLTSRGRRWERSADHEVRQL